MTPDDRRLAELRDFLGEDRSTASRVLHALCATEESFVTRNRIEDLCAEIWDSGDVAGALHETLSQTQLAVIEGSWVALALRPRIGRWQFIRIHREALDVEPLSVRGFLRFKERVAQHPSDDRVVAVELDLEPFQRDQPRMSETGSIGHGAEYLNRRLTVELFSEIDEGAHRLVEFLRAHTHQGRQLLLGPAIDGLRTLRDSLRRAVRMISELEADTPWEEFAADVQPLGLEVGWGRDARIAVETMTMLLEILEAPSPRQVEAFLARIPMIFRLAIVTPHGWFGQSGVLGRPDTGGQIVYILNQVRALEQEMRQRLHDQGLPIEPEIVVLTRLIPEAEGTTCDQRLEPVAGTKNARILRVPFRDREGEVLPHWLSRFEIWPYLERYALEAETELLAELGGRPDLIIGNYSDGNLVASLLAHRLKVTQCTIAHALEKSKYPGSDLSWQEQDDQYHFSCQFTADLVAMNAADIIITSSFQEIAGTSDSLGQYEGYSFFTMPGLYRVLKGIDVYDPRFNIVSPGANPDVYFSFEASERRLPHLHGEIEALVYGDGAGSECRGQLEDREKPLLFTMARMDRVKNITGLAELYGRSPELRERANLLVASGYLSPGRSSDAEERAEIERMHEIIDRHDLEGQLRWVEGQVNTERNGELYRVVADSRGAFVQPATYEAFGLTVIEAMATGLPTFATCFGGPQEIIEDGLSGFHIDPHHGDEAAARMAGFFRECAEDPDAWGRISRGALARVESHYTWRGYAERLMTLARIYGFWRHATNLENRQTRRYLQLFYALQYAPRAKAMES